ncbi:MAG: ribbon-helix-helix domain-containing protein [Bacillota bacterium]
MKKPVSFTLDEETIKKLKEISKKTDIPQARIVERAILKELENLSK